MSGQDQDINGVEIFRAGTYHLPDETVSYDANQVRELAENTNKLLALAKHEPPAKLGHDDDQKFAHMAGLPAVGWVKKVYAEGGRLLADFGKVPAVLAEAIRRGRYRHISSEIYDAAQTAQHFGDAVKGLSLRAVAFLGADVPVVKGMAPLMLGSTGKDGCRVLTMEVGRMDLSEKGGDLMLHANRHPMDALVGMKGAEEGKKFKVHAQNADDTYDVHDVDDHSQVHKKVPHGNLTLLSEQFHKEGMMDANKLAELEEKGKETARKLAESEAREKALQLKITNDRIDAFAEKHKGLLKQPPILAAFKALVLAQPDTVVKLAEKDTPYLDAFMAFAEQVIKAKAVLFGEVGAGSGTQEASVAKSHAVKLAEEPFKEYAQKNGIDHILRADIAVEARQKFAEAREAGRPVKFRDVFLAEAAKRYGGYRKGQWIEVTQEA